MILPIVDGELTSLFKLLARLSFAKTLAYRKINSLDSALAPLFCYNSWVCFDSLSCALVRCVAPYGVVGVSFWRISPSVNNSSC
jgi:hypothetical protein